MHRLYLDPNKLVLYCSGDCILLSLLETEHVCFCERQRKGRREGEGRTLSLSIFARTNLALTKLYFLFFFKWGISYQTGNFRLFSSQVLTI